MKKRFFLLISLVALLSSCGVDRKHFKIEGHLLHINQGELYVYNEEGSISGIDTLKVEGGRFALEIPCKEATTLMLVFPNFSEQPIFAQPGKTVSIEGDASHLKELEIKGTKDNELMTKFRKQLVNSSPPEAKRYAAQFVKDHPDSPVGVFLIRRYFVSNVTPDFDQAAQLIKVMKAKQPKNGDLARMERAVETFKKSGVGRPLPNFTVYDSKGKLVSSSDLSSGLALILCWASWSFDSMDQLRRVHNLERRSSGRLKVVSVSIDASARDCDNALRMDSVKWSNVCDGQMFNGKFVQTLGLFSVPDNILLDNGRIVARGLNISDLEKKIKERL